MTKSNTFRVNTYISKKANEWLDEKAIEKGLSKSALINIAIDNYIKETEVITGLPEMMRKLEDMGMLEK